MNILKANYFVNIRSLKINFLWTFIGNFVYAISQWAYLAMITKMISTEAVGAFTLGLAITAPIFVFSNLQLRGVQATDAKQEFSFSDYLFLRIVSIIFAIFLVIVVLLWSNYNFFIITVVIAISFYKGIESISDIIFGLFQKNENMILISTSLIIKGILTVLAVAISVFYFRNLISAAIAMSIVMLTTFLSYDLINLYKYDKFNLKFNKERLTRLFITSLPLGMVMLLISLNTNIPRYFIEHYVGLKQLGIFTSISYLMVAGTTIVSALGQTASPRLAKYYANGDKKSFIKLILLMIGIAILISVFGICIGLFAGDKLLVLIFNKEFIGYSYLLILIIISAGIGFVASFLGYGLTAIRVFKLQFPIFLCVVFSNAIASYILIPKYGLIGGAVALIIASIINILLVTIILINKLKSDLK